MVAAARTTSANIPGLAARHSPLESRAWRAPMSILRIMAFVARIGNAQWRLSSDPEQISNNSGVMRKKIVLADENDLHVRPAAAKLLQIAGRIDPAKTAAENHDPGWSRVGTCGLSHASSFQAA